MGIRNYKYLSAWYFNKITMINLPVPSLKEAGNRTRPTHFVRCSFSQMYKYFAYVRYATEVITRM